MKIYGLMTLFMQLVGDIFMKIYGLMTLFMQLVGGLIYLM